MANAGGGWIATLSLVASLIALMFAQPQGHGLLSYGMADANEVHIGTRRGGVVYNMGFPFTLTNGNVSGNSEENE